MCPAELLYPYLPRLLEAAFSSFGPVKCVTDVSAALVHALTDNQSHFRASEHRPAVTCIVLLGDTFISGAAYKLHYPHATLLGHVQNAKRDSKLDCQLRGAHSRTEAYDRLHIALIKQLRGADCDPDLSWEPKPFRQMHASLLPMMENVFVALMDEEVSK